ncbi:MAG TPA: beta-galactosidase trimerization domain-containing protein [bacterium]|nr:beta-galactosidase trimerization domain-containing protein [bacterium]HQG46213.1 beta-galactosidase trimerization domain-containing protein [bacterium]HQI48089.1 beta-galactosidase trimerization domain-containing protein [bacterium]HQJ63726.1 beta-galactosidase trimerization domain-containing protein [bacterium]
MKKNLAILILICTLTAMAAAQTAAPFIPLMDWGHWRLGQKADLDFLKKNHMTITFGSGAPNFETVSRAEFDQKMTEAKAFNQKYHDLGYIVLRYLSTSLNGTTATAEDKPQKEQIHLLKFYNDAWDDYADYLGLKPPQQDNPMTWITVQPDGDFPFYRYAPYGAKVTPGFETWGCPDNPWYVQMMKGRVRAQAETGIDGSYVDWTQIAGGTCYCDWTHKAFITWLKANLPAAVARAKYGTDAYERITLPKKRGEPFWMEWLRFRGESVSRFHAQLLEAARQVNPHFQIAGNVYGGFGYGPIAYDAAGNFEMLGETDTFLYSEIQEYLDSAPRKNEQGVKVSNSPALKFLAAASHGKPVIIYATEITPPIFPNPTDEALSAMAQINIAEAVANHCIFREKRLTPEGATRTYAFLADNEPLLLTCQLRSPVAILASLNQYLADELSFAFVTSRLLADQGIAHDLIVEKDLMDGTLKRYDLVVVPYLPLLSLEKQHALVAFARAGGKVLVLGESGRKDEFGLEQTQNRFLQALKQKSWPATYREKKVGKGALAYLPLPIPADRYLVPAKEKSEFTTFGPSMADLFADIPEAYTRGRFNAALLPQLTAAAERVRNLLNNRMSCLTTPSPLVEITTMLPEKQSHMLLHLVNYDVTVDGHITPATKVGVQLLLPPGKRAVRVTCSGALTERQPLAFKEDPDNPRLITFTVPEIQVYGLAVVELN